MSALYNAVSDLGEVWIVAPAVEQSGVSHAFSLQEPLRIAKVRIDGCDRSYAVRGTPVDTVKLSMSEILPRTPDLIISGINQGENSGVSILYSGTVGAAMEGAILGIPSIAVSLASHSSNDFAYAAKFTTRVIEQALNSKLPKGTMLNVNVPALKEELIKGVKITFQAGSHYIDEIEKRTDPRGYYYYWIGGYNVQNESEPGSDMDAVKSGYISITPLLVTQTNHELRTTMEEWRFE